MRTNSAISYRVPNGFFAADNVIPSPGVAVRMRRITVFDCPLCGHDCETQNGLRVHLHGGHLKSEIIDGYLEAVGE